MSSKICCSCAFFLIPCTFSLLYCSIQQRKNPPRPHKTIRGKPCKIAGATAERIQGFAVVVAVVPPPIFFFRFSHSGAETGAHKGALSRPRSAASAGGAKRRALIKFPRSVQWGWEKWKYGAEVWTGFGRCVWCCGFMRFCSFCPTPPEVQRTHAAA